MAKRLSDALTRMMAAAAQKHAAQSRDGQLELGIDAAPPKVRAHGLQEAHVWPLVSRGKGPDGTFAGSVRVPAAAAWAGYPSLELRSGGAWPCAVLDCDGWEGTERAIALVASGDAPWPNWTVTRDGGGSHVVYTLAKPVLRGADARQKPLEMFARNIEYLAELYDADRGYQMVLSHNPMSGPQGPGMRTAWGRREPYTLGELAKIIPFGWRRPRLSRTDVGRNCDLFKSLCRWAGSPRNIGYPVYPAALVANQQFETPLPLNEVAGIARSVERYRARWTDYVDVSPEAVSERQAARGRKGGVKSVAKRRKATEERDAGIVADVLEGGADADMNGVAAAHGVHVATVYRVMARDAPLWREEADGGVAALIRAARAAGATQREIAARAGVSLGKVWAVLADGADGADVGGA